MPLILSAGRCTLQKITRLWLLTARGRSSGRPAARARMTGEEPGVVAPERLLEETLNQWVLIHNGFWREQLSKFRTCRLVLLF